MRKARVGLRLYGKDWGKVESYIGTRTTTQIRSHAQKFFQTVAKRFQVDRPSDFVCSGEYFKYSGDSPPAIQTDLALGPAGPPAVLRAEPPVSKRLWSSRLLDQLQLKYVQLLDLGTSIQQDPQLVQTAWSQFQEEISQLDKEGIAGIEKNNDVL